jgi:hypothetical protein
VGNLPKPEKDQGLCERGVSSCARGVFVCTFLVPLELFFSVDNNMNIILPEMQQIFINFAQNNEFSREFDVRVPAPQQC